MGGQGALLPRKWERLLLLLALPWALRPLPLPEDLGEGDRVSASDRGYGSKSLCPKLLTAGK